MKGVNKKLLRKAMLDEYTPKAGEYDIFEEMEQLGLVRITYIDYNSHKFEITEKGISYLDDPLIHMDRLSVL